VGNVFSQNVKTLKDYYHLIDTQGYATVKGLTLTQDDLIRAKVIKALMCNLYVDKTLIEQEFGINFEQYFSEDLASLSPFIQDDLLDNSAKAIDVSPKARLLIRNICMSFDAYLHKHLNQQRYSRVI
jgi:oxygen-independent coproporphyrinogen-3 oxidase